MNTPICHPYERAAYVRAPRRAPAEKRTASGLIVREVDAGQMKGRDRNRPCPCGGGRKFKRCHGR